MARKMDREISKWEERYFYLRKIILDMFYRCSSEDFIRREKEIQTMILDLMRQQQELAERQEALRYIKLTS